MGPAAGDPRVTIARPRGIFDTDLVMERRANLDLPAAPIVGAGEVNAFFPPQRTILPLRRQPHCQPASSD
jgi:hypothetical protein